MFLFLFCFCFFVVFLCVLWLRVGWLRVVWLATGTTGGCVCLGDEDSIYIHTGCRPSPTITNMKGQLLSLSPMGVTVIPDNNALFFLVGFAFFKGWWFGRFAMTIYDVINPSSLRECLTSR